MMTKLLSIVVPCYNEEKNIPLVLDRFSKTLSKEIEVIMVDNGSTDNTKIVLKNLSKLYPFVKVVSVKKNQGYGYGIIEGLKNAKGQYLGWTHADMQTDPGDVVRSLDIIKRSSSPQDIFIKGDRKGRYWFDNLFSTGMAIYTSIYFDVRFREVNAQPTIFDRAFFEKWKNPPYDFSLDLYAYYLAKKLKKQIERIDVTFPRRIHGKSSWNSSFSSKIKMVNRTLTYCKHLKRKVIDDLYRS